MEITILYETSDVLVINKPAGLLVHGVPSSHRDATVLPQPTLVDWILEHYPGIKHVGEVQSGIERPGIVHRLDEETSGALIIAKTPTSFESLKQQFQDRIVQKEYHAFVWGHFKEQSGIVDEPIGRSSGDFRRWQSGRGIRGEIREAVTRWEVGYQFVDEHGEQFSYLHLFPKTGRTHQLRVHLKYLQRPIVSDSLYAASKPQALGFERLALHACSIRFVDLQGTEIVVEAPYPADFQDALAKYPSA